MPVMCRTMATAFESVTRHDPADVRRIVGARRLKAMAYFAHVIARWSGSAWGVEFTHDEHYTTIGVRMIDRDNSDSEGTLPWSMSSSDGVSDVTDNGLPEMRVAWDGAAYSRAEFEEYYTEHASRMWQEAAVINPAG